MILKTSSMRSTSIGFIIAAVCEFPNFLPFFLFFFLGLYCIQSGVKTHQYYKHSAGHKSHFMAFYLRCFVTQKKK